MTQATKEEEKQSCRTEHISNVPPDYAFTIVSDKTGHRVVVDAYTDYYFVGNNSVRTIYVKDDGTLYVKSLTPDARREVTLAEFVWEIYHESAQPKGYIVVQKKPDQPHDPQDYRIRNLEVVRKPKTKSLSEKRTEVKQRISSHRKRKSA